MRLVKLSTAEFADESALETYFTDELPKRSPKGLFVFNGHQIAANGLKREETILFSYQNKLRYVAKAETPRIDNPHRDTEDYRYGFVIKLPVRKANVSLADVERKLRAEAGLQKSLSGQGWTKISSERAEKVIEDLSFTDGAVPSANDVPDGLPVKIKQSVYRFIRDTKTSREIKGLYEYRCQVCGERLEILPGVFYSEAHHLQPLGGEHKGPDVRDNILCLCPNHHALFDYFAISLDPAKLRLNKHKLRKTFVDYHNAHLHNLPSS
jgi:hypothetical protein